MTSQLSREPLPFDLKNTLSTVSSINLKALHQIKYKKNCTIEDIREFINVTDRTKTGRSYLNYAVRYGKLEIVKGLIQIGASLTIKSHCDWNVLHDASFFNRFEIAEWILKERSGSWQLILEQNKFGNTPLHIACKHKHENLANLMIREVKKREIARIPRNVMQHTWLHASTRARLREATKLLLTPTRATPAEQRKCLQLMSGVDIFLVSPLQVCCLPPNDELLELVHFILKTAENFAPMKNQLYKIVTYQDETLTNAVQYCFSSSSINSILALMKFYLQYTKDNLARDEILRSNPLTHQNIFGYTILHVACRFQQMEILQKYLLEYTPDPDMEELFYAIDTETLDKVGKKASELATQSIRGEAEMIFKLFNERKAARMQYLIEYESSK